MNFKVSSLFLLFLSFGDMPSSHLRADPLDDEEIVQSFRVRNEKVSFKPLTPTHYSGNGEDIDFFNDLKAVGANPQWDQEIPYRGLILHINMPAAEEEDDPSVGKIVLQEFFYHQDDSEKKSSFLILKNFQISKDYQGQGIGRAALTSFFDILDGLDSSRISHDLYASLGNNSPGVFKMYLANRLNYFVNYNDQSIFNSTKFHSPESLERMKTEPSSSFTKKDVPTRCLLRREPARKPYEPYFFDLST